MSVIHGNEMNFNDLISEGIVLVDFYANWCGPCKMLAPILEEIASDRGETKIVKIDVDQAEALARNYGIMSIPTLILFKNGKMIDQKTGFMPKQDLLNWISNK
ncbi:MAG: thioredoxin [Bacilli bacterium]|nr:thioredoxin [Bacilli bacterium]